MSAPSFGSRREMRQRFIGIEGKFAAAAVVDHGRSVSQQPCGDLQSESHLDAARSYLASRATPRLYHGEQRRNGSAKP